MIKHRVQSVPLHHAAKYLDEAVEDGWEVLAITGDVTTFIIVLAREE
jgi:hypothetical protein